MIVKQKRRKDTNFAHHLAEAAHWLDGCALHEHDDLVGSDQLVNGGAIASRQRRE